MSGSLREKSALVIGAGGLGSPVLLALASAGVGRLVVCDGDSVESSNLNRQPLFGEADIGKRKTDAAAARLRYLHPDVELDARPILFENDNALALAANVDVVIDGSDNFPTKFLASDAALAARRPLVHGAILRYTAQLFTLVPGRTSCLRCLFESPPPPGSVPSCAEAGVLGALAGLAGGLMAAEALRVLRGEPLVYAGRFFIYEAREARGRYVAVRPRPGCFACEGKA